MAWKFLRLISGVMTETEAITTSVGGADTGKIPALDATGRLDSSFMPIGIGADTKILPASENLAAGDLVNVWLDSGTAKARKADASGGYGKRVVGFVLSSVTSGNNATVYLEGIITGLTGLTAGSTYYASATAGQATVTAPTTSGHIVQVAGTAVSTSEISFGASTPIVLA